MAGPRARSQPLGGRGMARGSILGRWPRSPTKRTARGGGSLVGGPHRLFRLRACRARARLDLGLIDTNEVIFQISGPPYLETLFDNCPR